MFLEFYYSVYFEFCQDSRTALSDAATIGIMRENNLSYLYTPRLLTSGNSYICFVDNKDVDHR